MGSSFENFSVLFVEDSLRVDLKNFSLGAMTTEILNRDRGEIDRLVALCEDFDRAFSNTLQEEGREKLRSAQTRLTAFLDAALQLPPYSYLDIKSEPGYTLLADVADDERRWEALLTPSTPECTRVTDFARSVRDFGRGLLRFREQVTHMLDTYFNKLTSRTPDAYAEALAIFRNAEKSSAPIGSSHSTHMGFYPVRTEDRRFVIAEEISFNDLSAFLYTDLFRGMVIGHVPRRCLNCGRFFLLTGRYDIRYCSNVAPGETERTCRKVGAHLREKVTRELAAAESPEVREYQKAYNRLKQRKVMGKISAEEWNEQVAEAIAIRDRAQRGEIDELEMEELFSAIGGGRRKWTRKTGV